MSNRTFVLTRSNPRRGRRRTERVSLWWLREFAAALKRGEQTARQINDLRELDARMRREAWIDPSLL